MNDHESEWVTRCMKWNEMCLDSWIDEWMDEWFYMMSDFICNGCLNQKKDNPITRWVIALINEQSIEWVNEWMNKWTNDWMKEWLLSEGVNKSIRND